MSPKKVEELALNSAALKNYIDKNGVPEKKHTIRVDDFELEEDFVLEQTAGDRFPEIYDDAVLDNLDLEDVEESDLVKNLCEFVHICVLKVNFLISK